MPVPIVFDSLNKVTQEESVNRIIKLNEETKKYGIILSRSDVSEIVAVRNEILQSCGRIETDISVTEKLICTFCTIPCLREEDFLSIINELHEIFYYMKNETEDKLGDDELIEIMRYYFDNYCEGSIELLAGVGLDECIRIFRTQYQRYDSLLEGAEKTWNLKAFIIKNSKF